MILFITFPFISLSYFWGSYGIETRDRFTHHVPISKRARNFLRPISQWSESYFFILASNLFPFIIYDVVGLNLNQKTSLPMAEMMIACVIFGRWMSRYLLLTKNRNSWIIQTVQKYPITLINYLFYKLSIWNRF